MIIDPLPWREATLLTMKRLKAISVLFLPELTCPSKNDLDQESSATEEEAGEAGTTF